MKKLIYLPILSIIFSILVFSCQKKEAFKEELSSGGYKAVIISDQPPHVGINIWRIEIYTPDGKPLTGAKVSVNGYMPPMPGMPEMSFDYPVEEKGSYYESNVNLSMGGTWQITIKAEKGKEKVEFKFGFNL
ncbi:FixH family protein [Persephonella sp.]|uniref:FixH family protein n=1 Tax=Persephonella sp. TaxID=2060922 RepID=UPI0026017B1A|nr:FixH family protein [Persephonella sp.]